MSAIAKQLQSEKLKLAGVPGFYRDKNEDGCRAEGWTYLAGDVKPTILLAEEPMKADVIHALTGVLKNDYNEKESRTERMKKYESAD